MDIDLQAFHFLRPLWLLLILPGLGLPVLWSRRHDIGRQLQNVIAPHLLAVLVVSPDERRRLRAVHLVAGIVCAGAIAASGPTWEQDRPGFLDDRAPLILAVDLSPSMDASDIAPTRLAAVQAKLDDLVKRRAGSRTALIAYAGSAHLVLPATEDPDLLTTFVQALSTSLIQKPGHDVLGVIDEARRLLDAEKTPATLVLITDGADPELNPQLKDHLQGLDLQVVVLAVGTEAGGAVRDGEGQILSDSSGRPVVADLDPAALKALADAADAPLGSLSLNDDDLDWIELHAQRHFQAVMDKDQQAHWKDAGYWLSWPVLLLVLLTVRRGWRVHWLAGLLLAVGLSMPVSLVKAAGLTDAFFTPDQQGRWAYEHQRYPQAAEHFADPYWKGVAAYQAADYDLALVSLAPVDTAFGLFYLGNSYVKLRRFPEAINAFEQALERQPDFPEARDNLALAKALQKDYEAQQEASPPSLKPDEIKFDKKSDNGKEAEQPMAKAESDELWLNNLTTSPNKFLEQKFLLQDVAREQNKEGQP
ncbi:VWA domain-containing protein [Pseudomonas sp. MS19]|uniref:VWA domain-containing protein n=1 Tax=Pseudomonas sp. MS19 TaxID=2579939 RepID=UPI001562C56E|nr:VWA domain-containing protein [Pseudomonas sp. MS19]NRH28363.1 VWA domain-containing protein [Pseudomonas sp. MS19]